VAVPVGDGPLKLPQEKNSTKNSATSSKSLKEENHDALLGTVYANDPARKTIAPGGSSVFPEGSILVREKPSQTDSTQAESLVVMIKRKRGFNPSGGDWQFLAVDGGMTKVTVNQKKGACLDCHQTQKSTDFVYPLK
jgi:Cytochrome P460